MIKKGFFKKQEYVYDKYYDCIICPESKILSYSTTNREGYRESKSKSCICRECSNLEKCTASKKYEKVVTRHIWEVHIEQAEEDRHEIGNTERSKTIERVFADVKERHKMSYTLKRGLSKATDEVTLIFACMNLKKLAMWK